MENRKYFQTISHSIQFENSIKKSRFIAIVREVETEDEVRSFLKESNQKYPDATHHCWAYRMGFDQNEISQYSDAGEPANTAGPPILQAIKQEKLTNVLVLVVRYFGGIKLGKSGLIKAYRDTARLGLKRAGKKRKFPWQEFTIAEIEYPHLGNILQSIESKSGRIEDMLYGEKVKMVILIPEAEQEWLRQVVNNATQGRALLNQGVLRWLNG